MWNVYVDNNSFENFKVSFYDTEILQFVWPDSRIVHKQVEILQELKVMKWNCHVLMLE